MASKWKNEYDGWDFQGWTKWVAIENNLRLLLELLKRTKVKWELRRTKKGVLNIQSLVVRLPPHSSSSLECAKGKVKWKNIVCVDNNSEHRYNWNICSWFFAHKYMTWVCKKLDMTRSSINKSDVHWRIRGKQSWGTTFCGGTNNAKGCKGGEWCCEGRTSIHKSVIESTTSHKGVDSGKSTSKGDGNGAAWNENISKKKTCNLGKNYTSRESY